MISLHARRYAVVTGFCVVSLAAQMASAAVGVTRGTPSVSQSSRRSNAWGICDRNQADGARGFSDHQSRKCDGASQILGIGIGTTVVGMVSAQPEVTAVGIAITWTGGVGGLGAGGLQLVAGLMQGAGAGDFSNALSAALTIGTGVLINRAFTGAAMSGNSASQRAMNRLLDDQTTVTGGVYDVTTSVIDDLAPHRVACAGN